MLALSAAAVAATFAACTDDRGAPTDAGTDTSARADASRPDASCDGIDAAALDPALVLQGRQLVVQLQCTKCHGQILGGNNDGVPSPPFGTAYPPNLTPDPATGLGCWSDGLIARAILEGKDDQGAPLCPPMPRFADAGVDQAQALAIVAFLRTLAPVKNQVANTTCDAPDAAADVGAADASPEDAQGPDAADAQPDSSDSASDAGDAAGGD